MYLTVSFLSSLFPDGLSLTNCVFGECAVPSYNPEDQMSTNTEILSVGEIVVLSLAGVLVLLACAGLLWAILYQYIAKHQEPPPARKGSSIEFNKLSYIVPGGRRVLKEVCGKASAGKVLAIMGPSGKESNQSNHI